MVNNETNEKIHCSIVNLTNKTLKLYLSIDENIQYDLYLIHLDWSAIKRVGEKINKNHKLALSLQRS